MSKKRTRKRNKKAIEKIKRKIYYKKKRTSLPIQEFKYVFKKFKNKDKTNLDFIQLLAYKNLENNNLLEAVLIMEQAYHWRFSWKDTDLCICESRKTIFECHLKNIKQIKPKQIKALLHFALKKVNSFICIKKECKNMAIGSHIVPKNIISKLGNKFLGLPVVKEKKPLRGINQLKWKVFCNSHDTNIFKSVDTVPFELNYDNITLNAKKAAYSELIDKKQIYHNMKKYSLKNPEALVIPSNINSLKEQPLGIRDIQDAINKIETKEAKTFSILFKTKTQFFGWAFSSIRHNPFSKTTFQNEAIYNDEESFKEYIYPSISSVVMPWTEGKMIATITIPNFDELSTFFEEAISSKEQAIKFMLWHLAEASNVWWEENTTMPECLETIKELIKFSDVVKSISPKYKRNNIDQIVIKGITDIEIIVPD